MTVDREHGFGTDGTGVILAHEANAQPVVRRTADAPQDGDRLVEVADDEVDPAVVIQVAEADPAPQMGRLEIVPESFAGDAELPPIVEQQDGQLLAIGFLPVGVTDGVAVGDEEILPAVQIGVDESGPPADVLLPDGRDARGRRAEPEGGGTRLALVAVQAVQLVLVVRYPQARLAGPVRVAGVHPHAAVGRATVVRGGPADHAHIDEADLPRRRLVHVQELVHGVVGDVHVRLAVAVHVHDEDAQPLAPIVPAWIESGLLAHVDESPLPGVAKELVGQAVELARRADVGGLAVVLARRVLLPRPIDVLADVQVGEAVAVEIPEGGTRRPIEPLGQAGLGRHVFETSSLLRVGWIDGHVVEQRHAPPPGNEEVGPAVPVVVGDGHRVREEPRLPASEFLQPDSGGHVPELAIPEIPVELARSADDVPLVLPGEATPPRKEHIVQAVPVEVDQPRPAPERFQDTQMIGLVLAVTVHEGDPGLRRDVAKQIRPREFLRVVSPGWDLYPTARLRTPDREQDA